MLSLCSPSVESVYTECRTFALGLYCEKWSLILNGSEHQTPEPTHQIFGLKPCERNPRTLMLVFESSSATIFYGSFMEQDTRRQLDLLSIPMLMSKLRTGQDRITPSGKPAEGYGISLYPETHLS